MPGIVTAVLLAVGRGIGDAATVLFTAGYTDNIPQCPESARRHPAPFHLFSAGKPGGGSSKPGLCICAHFNSGDPDTQFCSALFQFEIFKKQNLIMKDIYSETMPEIAKTEPIQKTTPVLTVRPGSVTQG